VPHHPMTEAEARAFLAADPPHTGKLATTRRDGRPHVAPIWFALDDDGSIVFTTFEESLKGRTLRRDPRAALCVDDEAPPFSFVTVGEALDAVLAKQNPDSTIVVAHQIGGRAALAAFAAHPGRAKGLVLIDVPVGLPIAIDDQQKKQFLEFMEQNYEAVASRMFSNMGRDTTQSKAIYTMFTQTPAATVKAYVREGFFSDGNKDAKAAKVPEQLVVTSRVWKPGMTSGSVLKTMGWEDTTARAIRVADAAFWVMKDQPDTLAAIVSQFATARIAAKK